MIHDWKMEIYWRLPVFMQEAALTAYAARLETLYYGKGYEEWRREIRKSQLWSRADGIEWQSERLQSLLAVAATRVPYYEVAWQGRNWKSIRSPADLHALPLLSKQSIRERESEFIVAGLQPRTLWLETTSGTTGTSLRIYWPKRMLPKWWALMEIMVRNVAGVAQDIPRAMMGGRPIVRGDTNRPPYWRFNRRWRQLYLSSYHLSNRTARDYVKALTDYGSQWITGYGSSIAALAASALETGIEPLRLKAAIVSGDTLLPSMRSSIERFFQCKCFDSYGQCEGVCLASECAHGRMHVVPMAGVLEILREDGSPCAPGEVGEMVATGLLNDAMPLIRYRVGDHAAWSRDDKCPCGNQQPTITNLEGRVDDYIITNTGKKIGRLAAFKRSPRIHSAQLVQDMPGHSFLLVRPGQNYSHKDSIAVRDDMCSRLGEFQVDILEVSEIPKTPQGKSMSVIRLMDRPDLRATYDKLLRENRVAPSDSTSALTGVKVLIMTSGHDVTDSRICSRLAYSIKKTGADVALVGKLDGKPPHDMKVIRLPRPSSRVSRFLWQPWRCLWAARRAKADIIHFHDAEMLVTLPVAKLLWLRGKFVYDVHEDFANLMLVRDWLPRWIKPFVRMATELVEKNVALLADAIVAVTPPLAEKFFNRERIVAYNYIAQSFFELADKCGKEPCAREFDLVHLGTLSLRRARFLMEVLHEFHRARSQARSLVIGVSEEIESTLRRRLPSGCTLIGKVPHEEIPNLLGQSKVGLDVHPWPGAHLEVAVPVKVCEYMAAKCAVVSSYLPVLNEILQRAGVDTAACRMLHGADPSMYARTALELIESIEAGGDPGGRLRQSALAFMHWDNEAARIIELYLRLLGRDISPVATCNLSRLPG